MGRADSTQPLTGFVAARALAKLLSLATPSPSSTHLPVEKPGFYGWAVSLEWYPNTDSPLYFRPVAPSDYLKMWPWWNQAAADLADDVRGTMKQGTLWRIPQPLAEKLRSGLAEWIAPPA